MPYADPVKQKQAQKQYYLNNKAKYAADQRKKRQRNREFVEQFKAGKCCARCPENYPACLEFHHENADEKDMDVSFAMYYYSIERIQKEIDKCILLCANCHRKLHDIERKRST